MREHRRLRYRRVMPKLPARLVAMVDAIHPLGAELWELLTPQLVRRTLAPREHFARAGSIQTTVGLLESGRVRAYERRDALVVALGLTGKLLYAARIFSAPRALTSLALTAGVGDLLLALVVSALLAHALTRASAPARGLAA